MQRRKKVEPTEYQKAVRKFHRSSNRHVLVLKTDITNQNACKIFHYADLERKAGNELVGIMKPRYEQLSRTKKYQKLKILYGKAVKAEDQKTRDRIADQMETLQAQYKVTWNDCRQAMIPISKKYGIDAVFALTKAEDIWSAVKKCLYADGKTLHFSKRGDLPVIRAKQINRGAILSVADDQIRVKFAGSEFGVLVKDRYEKDEVQAILQYLAAPDEIDRQAVETFKDTGTYANTYRPCFISLVCKSVRGKLLVYAHITVEGNAKPKYDRFGNPKHKYGTGMIGCDIGTQTIAYTSDKKVGLKNLAERGSSTSTSERVERLLYRAMDRSRRATNPQNYNGDGTIRRGHKTWKYSKRYQKMKAKHTELCRINAINRHLAINEDVNRLRGLGDTFVTEPKNAKKLQKRATKTSINKNGRYNRKKRFGRSIKNRCCGYFQEQVKKKFEATGGTYFEVSGDYRASQYDHTADDYIKKKLSDRMYSLTDGTKVQRDWYSSYLLYCCNITDGTIDKEKCKQNFKKQYLKEIALIEWIKAMHLHVLNSGIRVS